MHKTFKNQTRYNLDKTPIKSKGYTKVWQEKDLSSLYQRLEPTHDWRNQFENISNENKAKAKPMSIRNRSNKHARRFISSNKVD